MAIPLSTTTISVLRPAAVADAYDPPGTPSTVASGVRAHFSFPLGSERMRGGEQSDIDWRLTCDPVDLTHYDQVLDEVDGKIYQVLWTQRRRGPGGLEHTVAGVRIAEGLL